jgi:GNAT superfamily N-acetyltransferase
LTEQQGYADIEEFFVRPAYRGKRYGSKLVDAIIKRPEFSQLPLRLWVINLLAEERQKKKDAGAVLIC